MKKLLLLLLIANLFFSVDFEQRYESKLSHEDILKINPVAVVDNYTLLDSDAATQFLLDIQDKLVRDGVMTIHPMFGTILNTRGFEYNLNIIISSEGGISEIGVALAEKLITLKTSNISINCYVTEAQSMAFYLMVRGCSKVYAIKDVILMQHRSYYGNGNYTEGSYKNDIDLARSEASSLGVDFKKWLELTRGSEDDHVFTKEEIKQYKLVQVTL